MKTPLLFSLFLSLITLNISAQDKNTSTNKTISISDNGETVIVEIEESKNGETTSIKLEGDEAKAWIEDHGNGYSYSFRTGCDKRFSDKDIAKMEEEIKKLGVELEDELEDLSKYVDEIDVDALVEEIKKNVEEIQKEIEIKVRTRSDDSAVI